MDTRLEQAETILHAYACNQKTWQEAKKELLSLNIVPHYHTWVNNSIDCYDAETNSLITLEI